MSESKTSLKRTLLIVAFAGFVFSPALLSYFSLRPIQSGPAALAANTTTLYKREVVKQEKVSPGLPVRLKIPRINVDAALGQVSLTPQGAVDVPKSRTDAAWFDQGPRPGEIGSSVMVGHYGWENSMPAVFDNLHKLQKGDNLYVEDDKGTTTTFVVREFRTYGQKEIVPSVFISSDGKAHLNLITCQGVWNETQKSYSTRLVIFTDKE